MATLFLGHYARFFDANGNPLSGGTVEFYAPGTSTPKEVYTDSSLSVSAGTSVTLDSVGGMTAFLNGNYKVRLKDSAGVLVEETDNANPPIATEVSGGNLVANGSFEDPGNTPQTASSWTLTAQNDGTVERITADQYDGTAALKFTSTGNGGGQADTDNYFTVTPGETYGVSFSLKCSVADIRNIVEARYFDKDKAFLSKSTIYDEAAANPTSWTQKAFTDVPPANARFGKIRILGADQSDATAGEAKFDNVAVKTSPPNHASKHEDGGLDALTMKNLKHASQHEAGGVDEVSALPQGSTQGGENLFAGAVLDSPASLVSTLGAPENTWTTVSSGVPSGAVAVMLTLRINDTNADNSSVELLLRKTGSGDDASFKTYARSENSESGSTISANAAGFAIIPVDTSGQFDYFVTSQSGSAELFIGRAGYFYQ